MDLISLAIIILCFIVLIIYLKTKKYDSLQGAAMILLALVAIFLKLRFRGYTSNLFNPDTFIHAGFFVMGLTLIICLFLIIFRKNGFRLRYALTLLPLYIFFGLLQQLFFQYIFLESAYSIIGSLWPALIAGAIFYSLFHFNPEFDRRFVLGLFALDIIWGYSYLVHHNIFWLTLSHGIGATTYYVLMVKMDAIKNRLSEKTTRLIPRY